MSCFPRTVSVSGTSRPSRGPASQAGRAPSWAAWASSGLGDPAPRHPSVSAAEPTSLSSGTGSRDPSLGVGGGAQDGRAGPAGGRGGRWAAGSPTSLPGQLLLPTQAPAGLRPRPSIRGKRKPKNHPARLSSDIGSTGSLRSDRPESLPENPGLTCGHRDQMGPRTRPPLGQAGSRRGRQAHGEPPGRRGACTRPPHHPGGASRSRGLVGCPCLADGARPQAHADHAMPRRVQLQGGRRPVRREAVLAASSKRRPRSPTPSRDPSATGTWSQGLCPRATLSTGNSQLVTGPTQATGSSETELPPPPDCVLYRPRKERGNKPSPGPQGLAAEPGRGAAARPRRRTRPQVAPTLPPLPGQEHSPANPPSHRGTWTGPLTSAPGTGLQGRHGARGHRWRSGRGSGGRGASFFGCSC